MTDEEIFESSVRSAGDKAGVFEHDGETGYFYLYDLLEKEDRKVTGAIRVMVGRASLVPTDLEILWSANEDFVGLVLDGTLRAVFDASSCQQYGGDCISDTQPVIPESVLQEFKRARARRE